MGTFLQIETEQTRRRQQVKKVCDESRQGTLRATGPEKLAISKNFPFNILVDDTHKLLYCVVPKVGCTNWKRVFVALKYHPPKNPAAIGKFLIHYKTNWTYLAHFSPEEREYRLKNYLKFMFVRHPYERLLSAYMNKFVERNPAYAQTYGTMIINLYRSNPTSAAIKRGRNVTFEEFLQYVADRRSFLSDPVINATGRIGHNKHWATVMSLCNPCQVDYDFIGKYDNLNHEAEFVLKMADLHNHVTFPTKMETKYLGPSTKSLVRDLFVNIPDYLMDRLKNIYMMDLKLFDYKDKI